MATNEHITSIEDTLLNFFNDAEHGQRAILTDQGNEWAYKNSDDTKTFLSAVQGWTVDGATYAGYSDNDFGEITLHDDLLVAEYIKRSGGADDYIRFENDKISVNAGGVSAFIFEDDKVYTALNLQINSDTTGVKFGADQDSWITDTGTYMQLDCDIQSVTGKWFSFINGSVGFGTEAPLLNVCTAAGDFGDFGLHVKSNISNNELATIILEGDSIASEGIGTYATNLIFADNDGGVDAKMVGFRTYNNQFEILQFDDDGEPPLTPSYLRLTPGEAAFNTNQAEDRNFRVAGQSHSHVIYMLAQGDDGDKVGIKNSSPIADFDVIGDTRLGNSTSTYFKSDSSGNSYWVGDGTGLIYGGCYGNEIAWTQTNAAQNTWYDISDSDMVATGLNGVTHDGNGQLTVSLLGRYLVTWYGAFEADANNVHIQVAISVNGTETAAGMNHLETTALDKQEPMAGSTIIGVAAASTINISIRTTDAGTPDLAIDHLGFTVTQIGGL